MKKLLLILCAFMIAMPNYAQKLSKAEKKAAEQKAHDKAAEYIKAKDFIIVPASYEDGDGIMQSNTNNSNFLLCQMKTMYAQGSIVCGNSYTNQVEATEFLPKFDKKGNLRLSIVVSGRMLRGTYTISMRHNSNMADVIFTPINGKTRKFRGPVESPKEASYNKRSNPI
ncbi:MAG: hypothetical protein LKI53_00220 [Bacteroidales bacterium]|jgi:hypothetical protein|nr:hypothetical protein [Bacteroidales bacterium]